MDCILDSWGYSLIEKGIFATHWIYTYRAKEDKRPFESEHTTFLHLLLLNSKPSNVEYDSAKNADKSTESKECETFSFLFCSIASHHHNTWKHLLPVYFEGLFKHLPIFNKVSLRSEEIGKLTFYFIWLWQEKSSMKEIRQDKKRTSAMFHGHQHTDVICVLHVVVLPWTHILICIVWIVLLTTTISLLSIFSHVLMVSHWSFVNISLGTR